VFTRAAHRRRGVGDALISAIQEWAVATRVPVVEISVATDNAEGQAFLESLGYRPRRILMSLTPDADQA
jgi:ribosomal protein S18 acetylase RimI-like enzyme